MNHWKLVKPGDRLNMNGGRVELLEIEEPLKGCVMSYTLKVTPVGEEPKTVQIKTGSFVESRHMGLTKDCVASGSVLEVDPGCSSFGARILENKPVPGGASR